MMVDGSSAPVEQAEVQQGSTRDRRTLRIRRRVLRAAFTPAMVAFALCAAAALSVIFVQQPGFWVTDPRGQVIGSRLAIVLGVFAFVQTVVIATAGLSSAVQAARHGPRPGGTLLPLRLCLVRRRMRFLVWTVLIMRLMAALVIVTALIFAYTSLFGPPINWSSTTDFALAAGTALLPVAACILLLLIQALFGPFLYVRVSAALGAVAATWSRPRMDRAWAGINARLGLTVLASLLLLWGVALASLIYYAYDSAFQARVGWSIQSLISTVAPNLAVTRIINAMRALAVLIGLNLSLQIALPPLFIYVARRRLATAPTTRGE